MADTTKPVIAGLAVGVTFMILFVSMDNVLIVNDDNDQVRILSSDRSEQDIVPSNFKIVYSYGIGLDYTLTLDDSSIGTFAAENCHSAILVRHVTLTLSEQELELIWTAIKENNFFTLNDLTEECPPSTINCIGIAPANRAELQITADDQVNKVEFHQNYALNHDTLELERFRAIVSAMEQVLTHYDNLPQSDCAYL